MTNKTELRKAIKAQYPDLEFKVKTVDFTDLARDSKVFVESNAWGMTKGNQELYQAVKALAFYRLPLSLHQPSSKMIEGLRARARG